MKTTSELITEGFIYITTPYTVGQIFYTKKPGIAKVNFGCSKLSLSARFV